MQTKSFSLKMSDGFEIFLNRWSPDEDTEIKGVVQLHHGLGEHSMRYDRFGSILAENGYVLNAYDLRGHGKTAENSEKNLTGKFGKLADKNGFNRVVEDLNEIIENLKTEYPDKKVILFGHSFGSFVSQSYIEKYGSKINGCILCGTAGPRQPMMFGGKTLAKIVKFFCGGDSFIKLLSNLSFGSYNKRIENPINENAWLSANDLNVQMYDMDKWCGIPLTTSFFYDMTSGIYQIHKSKNMKKIPKNLPVYFIYGSDDPVGDYGKTIEKLYNIYKANGLNDVSIKAYQGDRHEILNENDKETVENDVIQWISKI